MIHRLNRQNPLAGAGLSLIVVCLFGAVSFGQSPPVNAELVGHWDGFNGSYADVWGDEPIWLDGAVVGFVTSGGYAHHSGVSVALGFLPVDMIEDGRQVEIEILGAMRKARLITEVLFDPKAERMRG